MLTQSQRVTMNFYGNLNRIGLDSYLSRPGSFQYKNTNDLYKIESLYNTNDYYLTYPIDSASTNPAYFVLCGTHTASMALNALGLATTNTNYDSLEDFSSLLTVFDQIKGFMPHKEIIVTGYSYGGAKAIYLHYNRPDDISKSVVFNPWMGKWASGFTTDPKTYLNPWHLARLGELHELTDLTAIPSGFKNLYVNYVYKEFASKYWQMQSTFDTDDGDKVLSIGWGIQFIYPHTTSYDGLPADSTELLTHSTNNLYDHSINNWVQSVISSQDAYLPHYYYGSKVISTKKQFLFPNHSSTDVSYKWYTNGGTIQLQSHNNNLGAGDDTPFEWKFTATSFLGDYKIDPLYTGAPINLWNLSYKVTFIDEDPYQGQHTNGNYYTIQNEFEQYARIKSALVTDAFRQLKEPAHLALEWVSQDIFNDNMEECYWFIDDPHVLTNNRRLLSESDYDIMRPLKANGTTAFVIQQPDVPNYYMEQQDLGTGATGEFAAIMQLGSLAQLSNTSGIKWTIIYNSTDETYQFRNILDDSVYLGLNNIWYVTGAGNTNMSEITNTNVSLESTGVTDEYYIKQVIPSGITVTLARVTHTHDNAHDVTGTSTSWSMTWYEFPDLTRAKFIIRPFDGLLDVANVNFITT